MPASLVLVPIARWPTRLPPESEQAVWAAPLPPAALAHPGSAPKASVILVTFNNLLFTRMCLISLLANTEEPAHEVLVVDNNSGDGTPEFLRELERLYPHVRVVLNPDNRGFAAANNQGLARARGEVLVLLNNDTLVPRGWLAGLVRHLHDDKVGLVGPVTNRTGNEAQIEVPYRTYGGFEQFARDHCLANEGVSFEIPMLAMYCVALRRELYQRVGPLDERFGVGLFEDDDYALRVRQAGRRVVCAEDVFVHHFGQASIGNLAARGEYGILFQTNQRLWEEKWQTRWRPHDGRVKTAYEQLTARLRELVEEHVPPEGTLIVATKGDDELLQLGGRPAWHFPQDEEGGYAGYHPANAREAVDHLEALRARGGRYLLLPETSRWWLDYYAGFKEHLDHHYRVLADRADTGIVFALDRDAEGTQP